MYIIYFICFVFVFLSGTGLRRGMSSSRNSQSTRISLKLDLDDPFAFLHVLLRAMSSPSNKEQFLKQFDSIVRGIVDNKERVRQDTQA